MCIRMRKLKKNLIKIMQNRKICCISTWDEVPESLSEYQVDMVKICGHHENQYAHSFDKVIQIIRNKANEYDLWLVAAGELGRLYTGFIKEKGGRALDIGFVIDFWSDRMIPDRLLNFIQFSYRNLLEFELTPMGKTYERYL